MGGFISGIWDQLWDWHDDTKQKLSFFMPGKKGAGKKVASAGQSKEKRANNKKGRNNVQKIGLFLGPLLFLLTTLFFSPAGLSKEAVAVLASTIWIATWWITEAVPIPVASLLPIILFPLTGAVTEGVTNQYGDAIIFLFLGGFVLAISLEKWNLHRRIALNIILLVGTSTQKIVLGFMVATGFLSMWISNTATAMMMMPIALSVITHFKESLGEKEEQAKNFGIALMLAVGYSASIGGLGTLIGTPPNTIFAGVVKEIYGIDLSFAKWMLFGVPISALILMATWFYLVKLAFPTNIKTIPGGREVILKQKQQLGKMNPEEKVITAVFICTALAWVTRTFILQKFNPHISDTTIAIAAAVALYLIPSKRAKDGRLLNWDDMKQVPWGILLLFGGGLAIAKGFNDTGLAEWIGGKLTILQGVTLILLIAAIAGLVIFLTEITSNTATATMMFPIMASLALALDVHPYALMIAAGLAASCAFMLPVATPPNAVVFGTGLIRIVDMVRAGFWLNVFSTIIITILIYNFLPFVWGMDISTFPESLK